MTASLFSKSPRNIVAELAVSSNHYYSHCRAPAGFAANLALTLLQAFEYLNVVIVGIVPVLAFGHIFNQVAHDCLYAVMWMETQNVLGTFNGNLIIANVLNMGYIQRRAASISSWIVVFTRSATSPTV